MHPLHTNQRGALTLDLANPFVAPVQLEILNALCRMALTKTKAGWERLTFLTPETMAVLPFMIMSGLASYFNRQRDPKEPNFTWPTFLAHMSATVVAGLTSIHIALFYGVNSINAIAVIASLAGWAGRDGINWCIYVFKVKVLNAGGMSRQAERERYPYSNGFETPMTKPDDLSSKADAAVETPKAAKIGSKEEFLARQAEKKAKAEEIAS